MYRNRVHPCLAFFAALIIAAPAMAQAEPTPTPMSPQPARRAKPATPAKSTAKVANRRSRPAARSDHPAKAKNDRHTKHGKQEAEIDSLDAKLRHDGCFWIVEIKYEVDLEGFDADEAFVLGLELTDDGQPILSDKGEPIAIVVDLDRPSKDKKSKREFKGRLRMRVHKDWVRDDDDLKLKASLIRAADGRVFDVEDGSANQDRPGPTLHIGYCGIGISIPL